MCNGKKKNAYFPNVIYNKPCRYFTAEKYDMIYTDLQRGFYGE